MLDPCRGQAAVLQMSTEPNGGLSQARTTPPREAGYLPDLSLETQGYGHPVCRQGESSVHLAPTETYDVPGTVLTPGGSDGHGSEDHTTRPLTWFKP